MCQKIPTHVSKETYTCLVLSVSVCLSLPPLSVSVCPCECLELQPQKWNQVLVLGEDEEGVGGERRKGGGGGGTEIEGTREELMHLDIDWGFALYVMSFIVIVNWVLLQV
jgi:hypothetical protein